MPVYDSDWLQSLLAQQGQQQPPAGPVPQPQGLSLNGYNSAGGVSPYPAGAAPNAQPARPYSPTPVTADGLTAAMYGPSTPPTPLPPSLPQNVQNYIRTQPSYAEGQRQAVMPPGIAGGEPYSPTPQIGDIQRLFSNSIRQNSTTGAQMSNRALLKQLIKLPGFSGFAGGSEI